MSTLLKVSWEEDVRRIQVPELTFDQVQAASLRVFSDKLQAWEEDLLLEFREGCAAPPRLLTKESFPDLVVQYGRQQQARLQKPGTPPLASQSPLRLQVVCRSDQLSQSPAPALLSVKAEPEDAPEPETPHLQKQLSTPPAPWWDARSQTIPAPDMSEVKEEQEEAEGSGDNQEAAQAAEQDGVADSGFRPRQRSVKVRAELVADERSLHRAARQLLREAKKAEKDAKRSAERALRKAAKAARQASKRARKTNRKAAKRVEKVARRMARHAKARKDACREKRDKKDKHGRKAKRELKAKRKATKEASQSEMYEAEEEQEQTEASASMPSERLWRKRPSTRALYEYGSWYSQAEEERECDEELRLGSTCEGSEEEANTRAHVQARKAKKQARKDLKLLKRRIKAQKKARKACRRDDQEGEHSGEEQGQEPEEAHTCSKCDQDNDFHEEATAALLTRNESPAPFEEPEEELRRLVELGFRGLLAGSPAQASGSS